MVAVPFAPPAGLPTSGELARAITASLWWLARTLGWLGLLALIAAVRLVEWVRGLPRENQGMLAFCGFICLVAYAGVVEFLSDPRTVGEALHDAGAALAVTTGVAVVALLAWYFQETTISRSRGHTVTAQRTVGGNTRMRVHCDHGSKRCKHGGGKRTAQFNPGSIDPKNKTDLRQMRITGDHEGGHVAAFLACGATGVKARATGPRSGYTEGTLPCRPTLAQAVSDSVMVSDAGWLACGTKQGADSDLWTRRQHLKWLPSKDRGRIGYEGRSRARRCVNPLSGRARIGEVSASLQRAGRWR